MVKILIDSDVLLDFFLQRIPFFNESMEILRTCEGGKVQGFITGLALSNVYYLLRKHFAHEEILDNFEKLLVFLDVLTIDKATAIKAMRSQFKDFEDALQNFAAAQNTEIKIIVTRNIKDYQSSKLKILTPTLFLETL